MNATRLPLRSPHLQVGPAEYIDGHIIHQAKHKASGRYFRMGDKEHFLLHQLDGSVTPESIAANYEVRFGKPLHASSLDQALDVLSARGLVEYPGSAAEAIAAPRPQLSADTVESEPFSGKIWFFNPDRAIASIAGYFHWLINGPAFLLWTLLLAAGEVLVSRQWNGLWSEFIAHPASSLLTRAAWLGVFAFGAMIVHELGHAVACKRYGGEVPEMGLLFRYFTVCAYTRIDDVVLLPKRLERVYVLMIGPLISLSFIPMALAVWLNTPVGSRMHILAADVLVWYHAGVLVQLIPFLQFDGYFILAQLLRMPNLRKDANKYLISWLMSRISPGAKPMTISPHCAAYVPTVCATYGIAALVVSAAAVLFLFQQYGQTLLQLIGFFPSIAVAVALAFILLRKLYSVTLPWILQTYGARPAKVQ